EGKTVQKPETPAPATNGGPPAGECVFYFVRFGSYNILNLEIYNSLNKKQESCFSPGLFLLQMTRWYTRRSPVF
ncbi:MAG: hypothetical protein Q7W05_12360, partial [Deltaproteobacteria bacterium]|nr:hypothetical protein [Deltaproteobacteria bacterium]